MVTGGERMAKYQGESLEGEARPVEIGIDANRIYLIVKEGKRKTHTVYFKQDHLPPMLWELLESLAWDTRP
jgi:hypothetical protein